MSGEPCVAAKSVALLSLSMADPFLAALDQATRTVVARVRGELPAMVPIATATPPSDAIAHYYCCDPDKALCGLNLSHLPAAGDGDQDCVVCSDLDADCPLCTSDQNVA